MLESVFIFISAVAFVTFVLGIERESIVYAFMSLMLWVIVMINALYVEVPTDTDYSELALSAFCLAFIFANIIWLLTLYFDIEWRRKKIP